jgi:hypothetical protein
VFWNFGFGTFLAGLQPDSAPPPLGCAPGSCRRILGQIGSSYDEMKIRGFWGVMPCSFADRDRRSGWTFLPKYTTPQPRWPMQSSVFRRSVIELVTQPSDIHFACWSSYETAWLVLCFVSLIKLIWRIAASPSVTRLCALQDLKKCV